MDVTWRSEPFEPSGEATDAADVALAALRRRGSPSHDGLAARLVGFEATPGPAFARASAGPLGVAPDPRRRRPEPVDPVRRCAPPTAAGWPGGVRSGWRPGPGRWALGAGGSVEVDENPADTMGRELLEEWSVEPGAADGSRRSLQLPERDGAGGRAGLAGRRRHRDARPRARRVRVVAGRRRRAGPPRPTRRCATWPRWCRAERAMRSPRLSRGRSPSGGSRSSRSRHSCVYLALLICAFVLGNPQPETFIFGLAHGLIWIGMSLVCIAAARARDHPLLAGRHRRGARRPRPVLRVGRVRDRGRGGVGSERFRSYP